MTSMQECKRTSVRPSASRQSPRRRSRLRGDLLSLVRCARVRLPPCFKHVYGQVTEALPEGRYEHFETTSPLAFRSVAVSGSLLFQT